MDPLKAAEFAASTTRWSAEKNPFSFCRHCHSIRVINRLGGSVRIDGEAAVYGMPSVLLLLVLLKQFVTYTPLVLLLYAV